MNKRIQELAEQAGFNPVNYMGSNSILFEKFAELIIRECAYASWIGGNNNHKKILEYFEIK